MYNKIKSRNSVNQVPRNLDEIKMGTVSNEISNDAKNLGVVLHNFLDFEKHAMEKLLVGWL